MDGVRTVSFRGAAGQLAVAALSGLMLLAAFIADAEWRQRHVLPDFFLSPGQQAAIVNAGRLGLVAVAAYLLLVVRPRLGRLLSRVPLRQVLWAAAPSLLALLLAIGVSELALRQIPGLGAADALFHPEPLRQRDPLLGWVFVPSHTSHDTIGGRRIAYVFDRRGYRVRRAGEAVDLARSTILFAGESVMLGHGLDWAESIPAQVEAMTGVQSANLAVEGYAADQAYLRVRAELPRFQQPRAVVILFMPTVVQRSLDLDRPHLDPGLVSRPPATGWRLAGTLRRLLPYHSEAEIARGVTVTRESLAATLDLARSRGARGLIVVPQLAPETAAETALRHRVLDDAGLPYLLVKVDPAWRIRGDGHPDPRATRRIAAAISAALASK